MADDSLLGAAQAASGCSGGLWRALMLEMLVRLEAALERALSVAPDSVQLLQIAAGFWRSETDDVDVLASAKQRCWHGLRTREGNSYSIGSQESVFDRALLCLLDPDGGDDEAAEYAEWFEQMYARL